MCVALGGTPTHAQDLAQYKSTHRDTHIGTQAIDIESATGLSILRACRGGDLACTHRHSDRNNL